MKNLLKKRAALEKRLIRIIRASDLSSSESRSEMIRVSGPLNNRILHADSVLSKQRAALGGFLHKIFRESRSLARAGSQQQVVALFDAVGDLPRTMVDGNGFTWSTVRKRFQKYQRTYAARNNYVQLLDEIRAFG